MNRTVNKYLPIAILYFFLNGFLLPGGLLYTTLLTPLFLFWLRPYPSFRVLPLFFVFIIPFVIIHCLNGVVYWYYIKSLLLFFSVFVFCVAFYQYLENCQSLRTIFKNILLINAGMLIVSFAAFFIPPLQNKFWFDNQMSLGNITVHRLRMLTYEPSYYSTLFAPIVLYYLLKVFRRQLPNPYMYIALVLVPLFLSLSFGVILGIFLSLLILILLNSRRTLLRAKNLIYITGIFGLLVLSLVFLYVFFPDNVFFARLANIISGKDQSFNGRTLDSFVLGMDIAQKKSLAWGTGFGQVKIVGLENFKKYYNNSSYTISDIGIPNSVADTLATLGLIGTSLKLFFEIYLYFNTRVYKNYFRLALFLFIFLYQFTGSFIMNIAEYAIWIMAFKKDLFPEFNKISSERFIHSKIDPL